MPRLVRSGIKPGNIRLYSIFSKDYKEKNVINSRMTRRGFKQYSSDLGDRQHANNGAYFTVWKLPADRPLLDVIFRQAYNLEDRLQIFRQFLIDREANNVPTAKKKHWPANTLLK